jgi:hypothetical protein
VTGATTRTFGIMAAISLLLAALISGGGTRVAGQGGRRQPAQPASFTVAVRG